jgi:hypothetical protein
MSTAVSPAVDAAQNYTRQELMAATAAREFADGQTCFIGTGLPMIAAYLAKATHAPNVVLVFESGTIDAQPRELAEAVGDFRLLSGAARWTGLYDALSLLQRGVIDLGFLGAAAPTSRSCRMNATSWSSASSMSPPPGSSTALAPASGPACRVRDRAGSSPTWP